MKSILNQISVFVFLLYYILVSTGVNIQFHYCDGEVSDFAVISNSVYCNTHDSSSCEDNACDITIESHNHQGEFDLPHQCCYNDEVYIALNTELNISHRNFTIKNTTLELEIIDVDDSDNQPIEINNYREKNSKTSYPPPYLAFQQLLVYS